MPETISVILSEPRPGDAQQQELVDLLSSALASRKSIGLTSVPHLYDLDPAGPTMEFLRRLDGPMIVISWLHPRAAYWTLRTGGVEGRLADPSDTADREQRPLWCLGLHSRVDPQQILDQVDRIAAASAPADRPAEGLSHNRQVGLPPARIPDSGGSRQAGSPTLSQSPRRQWENTRERWYPVIDRDRCSGCLECLNFCLFGVYGMDSADRLLIEQPDACRTGCPACSRICPEGAIMFPQHADPAISGGAEASLTGLKLDLSQLFSGADPADLARAERDSALSQVQTQPKPADRLDNLVDELDELDM